jgi:hypothetical protein
MQALCQTATSGIPIDTAISAKVVDFPGIAIVVRAPRPLVKFSRGTSDAT